MKKRISRFVILGLIITLQGLLFQNCSKVQFSDVASTTPKVVPDRQPASLETAQAIKTYRTRTGTLNSEISKVDLLLVIDNSGSMKEDSLALASKLSEFFTYLSNSKIDWQMCLTTTSLSSQGKSYDWIGGANGIVLNNSAQNIQTVVTNSVSYLFTTAPTSGDERGIAQAYKHRFNVTNKNCYRDGASFSSIIISDEDERSTGETDYSLKLPLPTRINNASGPIEEIDRPEFYISEFKKFSPNTNIQSHAIVIPSKNDACFTAQDKYAAASFGTFYEKLSNLTAGSITSICEMDYSANLKTISASILDLSQKMQLDCVPTETPEVMISPADTAVTYTIKDNLVSLNYRSDKSYKVSVNYTCD